MGTRKTRYFSVLLILGVFLLLTAALIGRDSWRMESQVEREVELADLGALENTRAQGLEEFLEEPEGRKRECLYLWNSTDENSQILHGQMPRILRDMDVDYVEVDVDAQPVPDIGGFEKLVLGVADYTVISDTISGIMGWTEAGGCAMIALVPNLDMVSRWLLQCAGVESVGYGFHMTPGIRLVDETMLGGSKREYLLDEGYESSVALSLKDGCVVHIASSDSAALPLLWEYPIGKGRMVVVNFGIYDKAYRGIYSTAYSLLGDACVWPVINGAAFYLDDFPAPAPGGSSEYIEKDYHMDTSSFYSQVWWEDIQKLGERHGARYTGMAVESYSDLVEPPFPEGDSSRFLYFGNMLLRRGGELGLHGYNHMPLCLEGFDYLGQDEIYVPWLSAGGMKAGLGELERFCSQLFPKERFQVYAPAANILSEEGRRMVAEEFPQIRAIAGVYLPSGASYEQEFEVAQDGIVETPRVISGYVLSGQDRLAALSELNFHFVSTHYQHTYDVLDPEKGAELGWEALYGNLSAYMDWLYGAAPSLRSLTGSELAGAVQRFYCLDVYSKETDGALELLLDHFQDEAWLLVRCNTWEPEAAEGGELRRLQGNLYLLEAKDAHIRIEKKVGS